MLADVLAAPRQAPCRGPAVGGVPCPLASKNGTAAETPSPAPRVQPARAQEPLFSPYWALICAEDQLLAPSRDSGDKASSVASAVGTGGGALGAAACGLLA